MGDDWDDVQHELNAASGGFFSPNRLPVGEPVEIAVLRYAKWVKTDYPIKDKDGKSLGYTWRFFLSDGRVWDVSNRNRTKLLAGLHPTGEQAVLKPGRFRVTNLGKVVEKQPAVQVEYLGELDSRPGDS